MTELSEGAQRAAKRISDRLRSAGHGYDKALLNLVPYVEGRAQDGDETARRLVENVERARVRMVSENMAAADMLRLG